MVVYRLNCHTCWLVAASRALPVLADAAREALTCAHASHISRSRTCFSRQPFTAAAGHSAQLCSRCPFRVLRLQ